MQITCKLSCRYMYIDYTSGKLTLKNTEEMENLLDQAFNNYKSQCKQLINWHIV